MAIDAAKSQELLEKADAFCSSLPDATQSSACSEILGSLIISLTEQERRKSGWQLFVGDLMNRNERSAYRYGPLNPASRRLMFKETMEQAHRMWENPEVRSKYALLMEQQA